ncbi:MAG: KpsF/GutQ family sugar-phosphate isomerase [Alphaproteobacteria bacterium]|nr:KpsF/GutQ family sugar-phosphate isomerase [Alphaproteobacteria bacterium]
MEALLDKSHTTNCKETDLKSAFRVLDLEIQGLQALKQWVGDDFLRVLDMLSDLKGKLIVSGIGKSGHIARKIAATFASTGLASHFVHPSEASHGDLGMITKDDVVLLLSNSGETQELRDMILYCKRFAIPLVGIVRRKTSTLAEAADVALILPEIPEASSVQAPTTSTTMMLAVGDALAIALFERKGLNEEHFRTFHPGGKLGASFIRVKELMHTGESVPLLNEQAKMEEVLSVITSKGLGCAGVVDDRGHLTGFITDGDLRRTLGNDFLDKLAYQVMTQNPITTKPNVLVSELLNIMNSKKITNLFVVENEKPVGVIHIHDILKAGVV